MNNYPVIKYAILFVIGILIAPLININWIIFLSFILSACLCLLISVLFLKDKATLLKSTIAYILIIISSAYITQIRTDPFDSALIKFYKEKDVIVYGKVESVELKREYEIVFTLITDSIIIKNNNYQRQEKLLCKFRGDTLDRDILYENIMPGNFVYVEGIFLKGRERRNPGEFDYNNYLNSKGIPGIIVCYEGDSLNILKSEQHFISSLIFSARKVIDKRIHELFEPETAGLLRGLLLADRSEIDFELKTKFINSGVIHVLAVSGLHVGYILLIFIFLFGRFNIYLRTILISLGLVAFMLITGVPPSVFRATVMALIILLSFISNRSTNLINSISLAAIIILLVDPAEIYNPGFQLSFSAVLSIGIIYPIIEKQINYLKISNRFIRGVILFIGVSLSAQIGTLPFTLAYFGKLSVIALLANLIVIPAIGIVIALAFTSLFVSVISFTVASYFVVMNDLVTSFLFSIIAFTGNLDYSFIWIHDYSLIDAVIFYIIIALAVFIIKNSIQWKAKLLVTILALVNVIYLSSIDDIELLP
ncbi:MAG: ComEC family competence protein, partial [Ignavibacteriaceae bacterium]|nr:ComEC family competence protein [Ignavibacteriaceae bacterium]